MSPYAMPGIPRPKSTIDRICEMTADYYGFTVQELIKPCRENDKVLARQMIWMITRMLCKYRLIDIGARFNKHHSTIIHGITHIKGLIDTEPAIKNDLSILHHRITGTPFAI